MKQSRMYDEFAHLWPLLSAPEDYADEARYWREALRENLGPGRHHVLELGVGGGNNLSHLTGEFDATAVDISQQMLANSRRLNPSVEHLLGDMRSVRLDRKFSGVLIHDAIAYMTTEADLRAVFLTAREHLNPGGVIVTAPDFYSETFRGPYVFHKTAKDKEVELTYVEYAYDPDPSDTTIESIFVYFINEGGEFKVELDRHVTGLFPMDTWERLLREVGFNVSKKAYPVIEEPRSPFLWVGVLAGSS